MKTKRLKLNANNLGAALGQALDDLEWCIAQPNKFKVDMHQWVRYSGSRCWVSLAGAAMVRRGIAKPSMMSKRGRVSPNCTKDAKAWRMIYAINRLRLGRVASAVKLVYGHPLPAVPPSREVPRFRLNSAKWFRAMRKLETELKEAGI